MDILHYVKYLLMIIDKVSGYRQYCLTAFSKAKPVEIISDDEVSLTVPGQSFTPREAVERALRNMPVPTLSRVEFDGEDPSFDDFDPMNVPGMDKCSMIDYAMDVQERVQRKMKEHEAAKPKAEPAPSPQQIKTPSPSGDN